MSGLTGAQPAYGKSRNTSYSSGPSLAGRVDNLQQPLTPVLPRILESEGFACIREPELLEEICTKFNQDRW